MAFFWNSASPTAKTSSITKISGSRKAATAKANRTVIPLLYLFTGVSMYRSQPENSIISSSLEAISFLVIPKIAPFKKIFSRPVISPLNPVPTSSKEAIRPLDLMLPVVGAVTFDNIFNKVDFPAPFLPMIPKTSPRSTSKLISCKAHT
ncbi:hypothetical protein D3C85_822260 [compost metagenome]